MRPTRVPCAVSGVAKPGESDGLDEQGRKAREAPPLVAPADLEGQAPQDLEDAGGSLREPNRLARVGSDLQPGKPAESHKHVLHEDRLDWAPGFSGGVVDERRCGLARGLREPDDDRLVVYSPGRVWKRNTQHHYGPAELGQLLA